MGSHRKKPRQIFQGSSISHEKPSLPTFPNNVGKKCKWKSINGKPCKIEIQGEIYRLQSDNDKKLIVLQQMLRIKDRKVEYRLGYYMIGVRPRMKGRWTWGQFATIIPGKDLKAIIAVAKKRKWL